MEKIWFYNIGCHFLKRNMYQYTKNGIENKTFDPMSFDRHMSMRLSNFRFFHQLNYYLQLCVCVVDVVNLCKTKINMTGAAFVSFKLHLNVFKVVWPSVHIWTVILLACVRACARAIKLVTDLRSLVYAKFVPITKITN